MSALNWGDPRFRIVAGAVVVVLAILFALDITRRRRLLEKIGHAPMLLKMAASVSRPRRAIKAVLLVLGACLVALAVARPQVQGQSDWKQRGIDVALVLDFSKSMLAKDVYPSRVKRMQEEADQLLDAFASDRVAVVAFAGASIHYPLTTDYEAAKILFHGLTPLDMAPGSDIGEAILTARCMLRKDVKDDPDCERIGGNGHGGDELEEPGHKAGEERKLETTEAGDRARAIVIFSDGEDTEGRARAECERAAQLGIQVFVVGVGTREGDQIPEYDRNGNEIGWKKAPDGSYFRTRLEEGALKDLAQAGGGGDHYFRDDPRRMGVENLVKALGRLKEGDLEGRVVKKYKEAYQWLLFPGFMVLLIEACISDRRRRT